MKLTLLNRETPVADVEWSPFRGGFFQAILKVHNPEFAPVGTVDDAKKISPEKLSDWWEERGLSESRKNVSLILKTARLNKQELMIKSLGLSLSDQYWVRSIESDDIFWRDVNFFTNDFSNEAGEIFFRRREPSSKNLLKRSPDYSLNGFLDKRWEVRGDNRVLVKRGTGVYRQQPFNEFAVSEFLKSIGCENFVPYQVEGADTDEPCSVCPNFIDEHTEYVPASLIRNLVTDDEADYYIGYIRAVDRIGMKSETVKFLDYVLMLDYLTANIDRNFGNFGLIRNVETLEFTGVAPIFDNGNSLWYDSAKIGHLVSSFPFRLSQNQQIQLVKNPDVFPLDSAKKFIGVIPSVLSLNHRIPDERIGRISSALTERISRIEQIFYR